MDDVVEKRKVLMKYKLVLSSIAKVLNYRHLSILLLLSNEPRKI